MPILKLTWCQAAAFTLPDLPSDRWQRVQMFKRKPIPLTIIRFLCTLGRKSRFVRRFEKLTLLPKVLAFPHTSHFPATGMLPSKIHCRAATRESLEPEHVQDSCKYRLQTPTRNAGRESSAACKTTPSSRQYPITQARPHANIHRSTTHDRIPHATSTATLSDSHRSRGNPLQMR